MILKGNQRAGGMQLARHLLNTNDNDHVSVHDLRGFVASDLDGAFKEAFAVSRGTRCKQFLFSLSLSPPETESVPVATFEKAIAEIENRMGLEDQPRAIVFHEKEGRRHAHCVWSRINVESMTAINLPHYKLKLRDVSRMLYLENDWKMPAGLANSDERNPLNFSRAEWQQAKRIDKSPQAIKTVFQDCWAMSDGLKAFRNALEARGYYLARGDRRGFVALDWRGEVYSLSKWVGVRAKEVTARFGDPSSLPSVEDTRDVIGKRLSMKLDKFKSEFRAEFEGAREGLKTQRNSMVMRQRQERAALANRHAERFAEEHRQRQERFRKGLAGVWDWITGKRAELRKRNAEELARCLQRDETERQSLIERQLSERRDLKHKMLAIRDRLQSEQLYIDRQVRRDESEAVMLRGRLRQQFDI